MRLLAVPLILASMLASATEPQTVHRLLRAKSVSGLARTMYKLEDRLPPFQELLQCLDDNRVLAIKGFSVPIPVREVVGTVIEDCFNEELPKDFRRLEKGYGVREICSFRTSEDELFRYHIYIYQDEQYAMMKALLGRKIEAEAKIGRHSSSTQ